MCHQRKQYRNMDFYLSFRLSSNSDFLFKNFESISQLLIDLRLQLLRLTSNGCFFVIDECRRLSVRNCNFVSIIQLFVDLSSARNDNFVSIIQLYIEYLNVKFFRPVSNFDFPDQNFRWFFCSKWYFMQIFPLLVNLCFQMKQFFRRISFLYFFWLTISIIFSWKCQDITSDFQMNLDQFVSKQSVIKWRHLSNNR